MDEELVRNIKRWRDADEDGQDEDADAACRAVFASGLSERPVALEFPVRTMAAIDAAAAADRRRARRMRRVLVGSTVAGGSAALYFGGAWAVAALSSVLVGILNLFVGATVRVATGIQSGADAWSVLAGLGRAFAAFIADPSVTVAMLVMQVLAVAGLIALQRLLGTQTESFK